MLIFVEDTAQKEKLLSHLKPNAAIVFFYKKRRIRSLEIMRAKNDNIFSFINQIIANKIIVCEYANFVPRCASFITRWTIESHIFGALEFHELENVYKLNKRSSLNKLKTPLCADFYYIYGKKNHTLRLVKHFKQAKIPFEIKARVDLPMDLKINSLKPWGVFIGQPFAELGMEKVEITSNQLFNYCASLMPMVYVRHPRQEFDRTSLASFHSLDGYQELLSYMNLYGAPKFSVSITSSLGYELSEIGITSLKFPEMLDESNKLQEAKDKILRFLNLSLSSDADI